MGSLGWGSAAGEAARAFDAAAPRCEALDRDPLAALRRMDHPAVTDVEADVAEPVEEDEVAGLQVAAVDRPAVGVLGGGVVRQPDPELLVDVGDEAGAVEPTRRAAAVAIRARRARRPRSARPAGRASAPCASAAAAAAAAPPDRRAPDSGRSEARVASPQPRSPRARGAGRAQAGRCGWRGPWRR